VGKDPATCNVECLNLLTDTMFAHTVNPDEVAAVIVEPVQGEGGYVVPHPQFLKRPGRTEGGQRPYRNGGRGRGRLPPASGSARVRLSYRIRPGDTLGTIAERYGTTVRELQSWNGLRSTRITARRTLTILARKM